MKVSFCGSIEAIAFYGDVRIQSSQAPRLRMCSNIEKSCPRCNEWPIRMGHGYTNSYPNGSDNVESSSWIFGHDFGGSIAMIQ